MSNNTESATGLAMGAAMTSAEIYGKVPVIVVPDGYKAIGMESYLDAPARKRGIVTLRDAASFISLVNQEKLPGTRIYGSTNPPGFSAVFNDTAGETGPAWRDHRAAFNCPVSVEWTTWTEQSGKAMSQEAFAQFIESNLPDIREPAAADMLEISRTLEAKKKVNFASGIRLSNGQSELTYEEDISGTASKGRLSVPEIFKIGIPVIEGSAPYLMECRLRYRIGDGKMAMWFEIVRPHKVMEHAVKEVTEQIAAATELVILNGSI